MPPDIDLVRQWMLKAQADLRAARVLRADATLREGIGFHCQQAVEKSLKAFLVHRDVPFEFSHLIGYLLDLCVQQDASFEKFRFAAVDLNKYAVAFRYPHPGSDQATGDIGQALAIAEQVFTFVLERLPPQAHPA